MSPQLLPETRIFIAGHGGLVGSALWRHFTGRGFRNLIGRRSSELDLRDARAVAEFFSDTRPDVVIDAAARVGGILANSSRPADFFSDNARIQLNLMDSAVASGVQRFLFLASSCIYPKQTAQPIREDALLTGHLEETNEAYAIAKIAGIGHLAAIRRQFGLPYICAMSSNLYGPGDNFSLMDGHVLPALIRRFHSAVNTGTRTVTCWGSGTPRREFLHVDDFADACHALLDEYDGDSPVNVGTGEDLPIAELAGLIAEVVGFDGEICWDSDKPDGTYQKLLDVRLIKGLGWEPKISLMDGIRQTYRWYREHEHDCRR